MTRRRVNPDSETAVVRECIKALGVLGVYACRTHVAKLMLQDGRRFIAGRVGWPDITGCLPGGRFLGVECKARRGGKQSEAQKAAQRQIERRGGLYIMVRGVDDLIEQLKDAVGYGC